MWRTTEQLPEDFIKIVNEAVIARKHSKVFMQIAAEWEVDPTLLSRWISGQGPLYEDHIQKLAAHLGTDILVSLGRLNQDLAGHGGM